MKYEVWTVWFIWKLFPFTWYCIWSKTWKNINIYRFFFPLEVQVTRKGNMQQRRVLRTVSSQTWKRHLFSESLLPSWPFHAWWSSLWSSHVCVLSLPELHEQNWAVLKAHIILQFFCGHFYMLNCEWLIIIFAWIFFFY